MSLEPTGTFELGHCLLSNPRNSSSISSVEVEFPGSTSFCVDMHDQLGNETRQVSVSLLPTVQFLITPGNETRWVTSGEKS